MTGLDKLAIPLMGGTGAVTSALAKPAAAATPFADVVQSMVTQSEALGRQASGAVTGLLDGSGTEIHDVMIAQQKASVAFELGLQVRNKAVSAYQQMMGMQF